MKKLDRLDWPEIIAKLSSFATSDAAKEKLLKLSPLPNERAAEDSFSSIQKACQVLSRGSRPFMESLNLFSIWSQRLQKEATLKTLELRDVRHFCIEVLALKELLNQLDFDWSAQAASVLMDSARPLSAIDQLMSPDGEIRVDASEVLYKLHNEKTSQVRKVQNTLDRLTKDHELEDVLQDRYVTNREGRWVLPVKSGMRSFFEGIIHASSQSKQTVFMEPKEIIPINNRLREIEVEMEEEIERLLSSLSRYLQSLKDDFASSREQLLDWDLRLAQGQLSLQLESSPCRFSKDRITLTNLRHPLLVLDKSDVIPNSVKLNPEQRILLLSGPNAGGKTILLKSIGLAAQMARCGLPICADPGSELPFFKELFVALGDEQSVDQHLSTFAAHLKVLHESTQVKGSDHLLLIDEICGSTDPEEGTALARAFIEEYSKNKVFSVITSHLGPLKLGWGKESGLMNGSLEYDMQSGRPTYQFIMGVPGQSLALKTAKRVGISGEILERALSYLSRETLQFHSGLEEIEQMKVELRNLKDQTLSEAKEMKALKSRYTQLAEKFEKEKTQMLSQASKRAERKIESLIEQAKVTDLFKRHESLEKAKAQLPEIVKASQSKEAEAGPRIESADDFAKVFPPGSKVFAQSVGRDAVVQGFPNAKGEVPVLSNSMRLMISWDQLRPPHMANNPTMDILRKSTEFSVSPLESDRVVDLRGLNVEEAINRLELQLDTAALHHEDRIKVIHGHGTETLKKAIRSYLSRSVYVKKWLSGSSDSGGDGVTWAELQGSNV